MTWTPLTADAPLQLRPRPKDHPYRLTYNEATGKASYAPLESGDLVLPVPDSKGALYYPVTQHDGRMGYDPDCRVALAVEAGAFDLARQWLKATPSQWLTPHPMTQKPAYLVAMESTLSESQNIRLWRTYWPGHQPDQMYPFVVEFALRQDRAVLADWLVEKGVSWGHEANLAMVLQLNPVQAWARADGRQTSSQPPSPDGMATLKNTDTVYDGLRYSEFIQRYANRWQTRLQERQVDLQGTSYTYVNRHMDTSGEQIRQEQVYHSAASLLLSRSWPQSQSFFQEITEAEHAVQRSWMNWLAQRGLDWSKAGPQYDDQLPLSFQAYLEHEVNEPERSAWRAWLREQQLQTATAPATPGRNRLRS